MRLGKGSKCVTWPAAKVDVLDKNGQPAVVCAACKSPNEKYGPNDNIPGFGWSPESSLRINFPVGDYRNDPQMPNTGIILSGGPRDFDWFFDTSVHEGGHALLGLPDMYGGGLPWTLIDVAETIEIPGGVDGDLMRNNQKFTANDLERAFEAREKGHITDSDYSKVVRHPDRKTHVKTP